MNLQLFYELVKIFIISVVQGITEWLPISSTGHMILVEELFPLAQSRAFWDMFQVLVQLGSIFAVVILYFHKLNPFSPSKSAHEKEETWVLWFKVAIASVPAAILGLLADDWISDHLKSPTVIALMLILYGIAFIWIENRKISKHTKITRNLTDITYQQAAIIGCFQALALIPGTSRSGATIVGALLIGMSRFVATEFSFFMSIPVMFGASFLKLIKFGFDFTAVELGLLIFGMFVAFVVSWYVIKFLLNYIRKNDFKAFGYYRIVLGIIVLFFSYFMN